MEHKPGFDIFSHSLGNVKLCGPLAVITFVFRKNTGTVDTCGKLVAVHLLHSLQLKETRSRKVGRRYILRKLRIGTCRRSDGSLQIPSEDLHISGRIGLIGSVYAEYGASGPVLGENPVHQLPERHTG